MEGTARILGRAIVRRNPEKEKAGAPMTTPALDSNFTSLCWRNDKGHRPSEKRCLRRFYWVPQTESSLRCVKNRIGAEYPRDRRSRLCRSRRRGEPPG